MENGGFGVFAVIWILFYSVLVAVAYFAPLKAKLVVLAADLLLPDPVPYVDEILMIVAILRRLDTVE